MPIVIGKMRLFFEVFMKNQSATHWALSVMTISVLLVPVLLM